MSTDMNRSDTGDGGVQDTPIDTTMVPSPNCPAQERSFDTEDLLQEAEDVGRGIFDEDIRELVQLYAEPHDSGNLDATSKELHDLFKEPQFQVTLMGETSGLAGRIEPREADESSDNHTRESRPRLHLILGDSLAAKLDDLVLSKKEPILNLAVSGNTWAREKYLIKEHIREWEDSARNRGLRLGKVFVWLGSNEVYGRPNQKARGLSERDVTEVMEELGSNTVLLAGPIPRLWCDAGARYEETPAFAAERLLQTVAATHRAQFVPYLGRAMTCMLQRRHVVRHEIAVHWYKRDGVHLSLLGYQKLQKKLQDLFG